MIATPRATDDLAALIALISNPAKARDALAEIQQAQEVLDKRKAELDERERALVAQLANADAAAKVRAQHFTAAERDVEARTVALDKREADARDYDKMLDGKKADVAAQNQAAMQNIANQDAALRARDVARQTAKLALAAQREAFADAMRERGVEWTRRDAELKARDNALSERERIVAAKEARR